MLGLEAVLTVDAMLMLTAGVLLGILVGAIPGFTANMGIAILLPFTFAMDPLPGLMLLLGLYASALYSGAIPAILIKTPGTPGAAATVLDGFPLAAKGRAGEALTVSLVSSSVGGIIGVILLALLVPFLAAWALSFGAGAYFMLAVFALVMIASLSEGAVLRGVMAGLIGVGIATVGQDPIQAFARYTFGIENLSSGIEFVPVLVGVFGVAEALTQYEKFRKKQEMPLPIGTFSLPLRYWAKLAPTTWWSSLIGFFVGVAPGAGGTVASFLAYNEGKRFAKGGNETFGKGDPRGVAAAEASNNSSIAGALAPMLTLGLPGDAATALLIGAITVHGLRPGPGLFEANTDLVYGLFVGLIVAYILVLIVGYAGTRLWGQVLRVPRNILWPIVLVLCMLGSFSLRGNTFDILVMAVFGVIGWLMMKGGVPIIPLVVGVIVGPIAESNLRRALVVSDGSFTWLLDPIPISLLILTVLSLGLALWRQLRSSRVSAD
nr:tripartite tricarboxylate transporter permease [Ornithinimicrobium sp. HY1745]